MGLWRGFFQFALVAAFVVAAVTQISAIRRELTEREIARLVESETLPPPEEITAVSDRSAHMLAELAVQAGNQAVEDRPINDTLRLKFYCQAIRYLEQGIERKPYDGVLLTYWARLSAYVGKDQCEGSVFSPYDPVAVARRAVTLDPMNSEVLFGAGRALLVSAEQNRTNREKLRLEALALWKRSFVLRTPKSVDSFERELVVSQVQSPTELISILPKELSPLVHWAEVFRRERPELWRVATPKLSKLFTDALNSVSSSVQGDTDLIPLLWRTEYLMLSDQLRQAIDAQLSALFRSKGDRGRSNRTVADYFSARAKLSRLVHVPARAPVGSRPEKGNLTSWGDVEPFFLDEYYRSVGAFLGADQWVSVVEVEAHAVDGGLTGEELQLFVSQDNQLWQRLKEGVKITSFEINSRRVISLAFPPQQARYVKIHYGSSVRPKTFRNSAHRMIQAFGRRGGEP